MKRVINYEIIRHGIDHPDYFPGCGVAYTDFDYCYTGIGDTEYKAFQDALEMSYGEVDWGDLLESESIELDRVECEPGNNDMGWFVSVRIKTN